VRVLWHPEYCTATGLGQLSVLKNPANLPTNRVLMRIRRTKFPIIRLPRAALMAVWICASFGAHAAPLHNLTGLPTYPNLQRAAMDDVLRTEALGRWCARFTATTWDSLTAVESWYRKTLMRASETDLIRDERFNMYPALSGIKLALGRDYVALYRLPNQPTIIELHRCTWN
jgi:hypothetical protein